LRIALFHNLPSGGGKRTLAEQVKRLSLKHDIDVFTLSCAEHNFADLRPYVSRHEILEFQPLPLFGSPFGRLNQAIRLIDLIRLHRPLQEIVRQIRAGNYDLVFVHPCQSETSSTLLRLLGDVPSAYYCQEPLRRLYEPAPFRPYENRISWLQSILNKMDPLPRLYHSVLRRRDRLNTRSANRVLVNSLYMRDLVEDIYEVDPVVSYHAVDTELFQPVAAARRNMVLSVGSLTPLKGFDFIIEAMGRISTAGRPSLVIVSNFQNEPERVFLGDLSRRLGVQLELLNNVSDDCLVQLYSEAKMIVYAPVREPFGLVPLEAMACGRPVVAVREGGVAESIVHEKTGLLVERDPDQFAAAVQRLLENPELAAEFGQNGREHAQTNWTWAVAIANLEQHLLSLSES
jgi:glycosyltransferase involved in cell wall biosynthesis